MQIASHLTVPLAACALATFAGLASAQSVQLADFSNLSSFTLLGSSAQSGTRLRLTNTVSNQTGNTWHTMPLDVLAGFDTQFEFSIVSGPTLAEGMAFTIQNDPLGPNRAGGSVWGLGYGIGANNSPVNNSLSIEIDTFQDGFLSDSSSNELSVHTNGTAANDVDESASIGRVTPPVNMSDGAVHTMRVRYVPGTLEVFIDDLVTPRLTVPYDLQTGGVHVNGTPVGGLNLPTGQAIVGFSASTGAGGLTERVEIHSWSWTSLAGVDPCFAGNVLPVGGGDPVDVLKINGDAGDFFRRVEVFFADPWSIDFEQPPTVAGPVPFLLFATLGAADGSSPLATPFGTLCFSNVAILNFGVLAPSSVQVPAGLPLLGEITLQAVVVIDTSAPGLLATTNAVVLEFVAAPVPTIQGLNPPSGTGGAMIEILGSDLSQAATVEVNGATVPSTWLSRSSISFTAPAAAPCDSTVVVVNPDGQTAGAPFNPTPTVTGTLLSSGPAAGGATFIVRGTGFGVGTTVTIGGAAATVLNPGVTTLVLSTPPGTPGQAQVVVTTVAGCSVTTTYTYL